MIRERFNVQFRVQAINATNTPHFDTPNANVDNMALNPDGTIKSLGGFTQCTSINVHGRQVDERQLKLGIHIRF